MKIVNVIGGLEEKKIADGWTNEYLTSVGHNQLCNREVEFNRKEIKMILLDLLAGYKSDLPKEFEELAVERISKAIEQGKVLKVDIGGRE